MKKYLATISLLTVLILVLNSCVCHSSDEKISVPEYAESTSAAADNRTPQAETATESASEKLSEAAAEADVRIRPL